MDRREFLKACLTLGALGAAARFSPAFAGLETTQKNRTSGKAKSVIELWIWGGPSQLEAFDPKPKLAALAKRAQVHDFDLLIEKCTVLYQILTIATGGF